ncbi:MAG: type II toxin-antitoxin system VapC family toxin [Actinobacteria bacterium]|jgi:predicted nucleic acid-binding protein|nr:MAG: type II toxin-antitoxin system VapC family toxin [Actinomycetota bacterium]
MLDTSAVSAFFQGHEETGRYVGLADELVLNPVVIGELLAGFRLGRHEKRNRQALEELLSSPRVRTIGLDGETSERYASIFVYLRNAGSPIPTNDLWIAASAMQHGLKLLTMDRHYLKVPQIISILCEA